MGQRPSDDLEIGGMKISGKNNVSEYYLDGLVAR